MNPLPNIFVVGDLCVDLVTNNITLGGITPTARVSRVGGSAFNAAKSFSGMGFPTRVFGRVGKDTEGDAILAALDQCGLVKSYVDRSEKKPTCVCNIVFFANRDDTRTIFYWHPNANEYDQDALEFALSNASLSHRDIIYSSLHVFDQSGRDKERCARFFSALRNSGARLIVDLVPHRIFEIADAKTLTDIIGAPPYMYIAEFRTLMNLIAPAESHANEPSLSDCQRIMKLFPANLIVCRYGFGNIATECIFQASPDSVSFVKAPTPTGYADINDDSKIGFGDRLTADTLQRLITENIF